MGARWVARYAEDERAYQIAYEKELEQKRKKSSARPADTVRSQGLSDIPGEVQSPPQRPRHTLSTDISGMVTNSIFALTDDVFEPVERGESSRHPFFSVTEGKLNYCIRG